MAVVTKTVERRVPGLEGRRLALFAKRPAWLHQAGLCGSVWFELRGTRMEGEMIV